MDIKSIVKNISNKIFDKLFYSVIIKLLAVIFKLFPMKNRVFFYSIRGNDKLLENAECVYESLDCEKVVISKMLPHSYSLVTKICFYLLTSKVVVTDDYLKYLRYVTLRNSQKVVQIWHACGAFKKFGLNAPSNLPRDLEKKTHTQYDAVCVSSDFVRKYYASAFGIGEDKVVATGVPRTDNLFDEKYVSQMQEEIYSQYNFLRNKRIYLYCPTFREKDGVKYKFDVQIDFDKLSNELNDNEVFVMKRHPAMKDMYFDEGKYNNIFDLTDESVLSLMSVSDVVITDYSSVIFEASLLKKAILFYCPDFDSYERSFYMQYPDDFPGEMIKSSDILLEKLRISEYDNKTENFVEKELSACDGNSTESVCRLVINMLLK